MGRGQLASSNQNEASLVWGDSELARNMFPHTLRYSEQIQSKNRPRDEIESMARSIADEYIDLTVLCTTAAELGLFNNRSRPLMGNSIINGLSLSKLDGLFSRADADAIVAAFRAQSSRSFLAELDDDTNPFLLMIEKNYLGEKLAGSNVSTNQRRKALENFCESCANPTDPKSLLARTGLLPKIEYAYQDIYSMDPEVRAQIFAEEILRIMEVNTTIILAHHMGIISDSNRMSMMANPNFLQRESESQALCSILRQAIRAWNLAEDQGLLDADQRRMEETRAFALRDIRLFHRSFSELEGYAELYALRDSFNKTDLEKTDIDLAKFDAKPINVDKASRSR